MDDFHDEDDWKSQFALNMRASLIADTIYQIFDIDMESNFEREQFDTMFAQNYRSEVFLISISEEYMTEELCITNLNTEQTYQVTKFNYQTKPMDGEKALEFSRMPGRDYSLFCHDEALSFQFHLPENN